MAISAATAMLLSAGMSAFSSISQGQAAKKQSEFQASVYRQQAEQERKASEAEERDFRRKLSAQSASHRAAMGASGTQISTGTPLLAFEDFAAESELQAQRIREGGRIQSTRLEQQAQLTKMAGKSAQTRGFARAGSSLLSGIGQAYA